jgi:hypothetical protein
VRVVTKLDKKIGVRLNQAIMVLQTLEQIAAECEKRLAATAADDANESSTKEQGLAKKLFNALRGR